MVINAAYQELSALAAFITVINYFSPKHSLLVLFGVIIKKYICNQI